ncbi:MAG: hypothetical protein NTZ63_06930 [Candidatus Omnitrophica bacterium]|nr:hypothetical protein [Candidatus Omnitrophota bacterium]
MFMRKGQSILEYSILLAVVIAVLLIMQAFVKRGYQGSLKSSSEKMGEQFSASSTTIKEEQAMAGDQKIITEVGTTTDMMGQFVDKIPSDVVVSGTLAKGAYSLNTRQGGVVTATTQHNTASASQEKARLGDYAQDTVTNFTDPDLPD